MFVFCFRAYVCCLNETEKLEPELLEYLKKKFCGGARKGKETVCVAPDLLYELEILRILQPSSGPEPRVCWCTTTWNLLAIVTENLRAPKGTTGFPRLRLSVWFVFLQPSAACSFLPALPVPGL